jgi:hypothetical protein
MKTNTNLPQITNYKKPIELKYNFLLLSIFSVVLLLISLVSFNLLRIFIETGRLERTFSGSFDITDLVIIMVTFTATIICHELVHGIVFKLLKYKVSFGLILPFGAYTIAKNQLIQKKDYFIIGIAPLMVINFVCILLLFLKIPSISDLLVWILVFNTSGAAGDLWLSWVILKSPKDTLFYDTSPSQNYIYHPDI